MPYEKVKLDDGAEMLVRVVPYPDTSRPFHTHRLLINELEGEIYCVDCERELTAEDCMTHLEVVA